MSQIARITTWSSGQTLTASALNGEFNNIVNAWNNQDNGTSTWTKVIVTTLGVGTTNPGVAAQIVGVSGQTACLIEPQGAIPDNTDTAGLYILHQGTTGTGFRVRTDANLTGSQLAQILVNNSSTSMTAFNVSTIGTGSIQTWTGGGTTRGSINNVGIVTWNTQSSIRAHRSTDQSISSNTSTKVQFDTKDWDNQTEYDNATNYRFTATVAGKYLVSAAIRMTGTSGDQISISIFKNGSATNTFCRDQLAAGGDLAVIVADVLNLAAADYVEIFVNDANNTSTVKQNSSLSIVKVL